MKQRRERETGRRKGVWKAVYGSMTAVVRREVGRVGGGTG